MRKSINYILFIVSLIVYTSCSSDVIPLPEFNVRQMDVLSEFVNTQVSLSDVITMEHSFNNGLTRGNKTDDIKIIPVVDEQNDTIFFAVDYPTGGWKLYASDKRVPSIVAYNEEGSYEKEMENESAAFWVETMKADMKVVKKSSNDKLNFTADEIKQNIEFWNAICFPDVFVKSCFSTRAPGLDLVGHYELVATSQRTEVFDSIPHLISVAWHQGNPFNVYCPLRTDDSNKRAYAGCVAIAGAQMLYYLHDKFVPRLTAPSQASCVGNVNSYTMNQWSFNETIWDNMQYNEASAAPLIANVGWLVETNYKNQESSAHTEDLPSNVFSFYGLTCSLDSYDENIVKSSLLSSMPVIIGARSSWIFGTGHSFIIDGYKRYRTSTTNTYRWVYDQVPDDHTLLPAAREYTTTTYTSPTLSQIRMNWGWGPYNSNDTWFTLTGNWVVTDGEDNYNFTHHRKMIHNFTRMQ